MPGSRLIVALDGLERRQALDLSACLRDAVWGFKVNDLLVECGVEIVRALKPLGRVFADAKLHDIPHTVANGVRRLASAGADLITVHASGGTAMVQAAVSAAGRAKILAVTVLTSLSDADCDAIYHCDTRSAVLGLANLAARAGAGGIVCSPHELERVRSCEGLDGLLKVTPGIRPAAYGTPDDQRRTWSPRAAIQAGADLLVVGRPITAAADPRQALEQIVEEIRL